MVLELQKTKKTIVENEQLRKEVAYHTAQTEILLQQNEKLLQDLAAANRTLQLAKEVRKFHMILKNLCISRAFLVQLFIYLFIF